MGVHALTVMASDPERSHTSEEIATSIDTNAVVVRRILASLQSAGLVTSQKGPTGGSKLARPAKKVTLADVLRAIEKEPVFAVPYKSGAGRGVAKAVRGVFKDVEAALQSDLDGTTLAQVVKRAGGKSKK